MWGSQKWKFARKNVRAYGLCFKYKHHELFQKIINENRKKRKIVFID
jgi:hypothetical protein